MLRDLWIYYPIVCVLVVVACLATTCDQYYLVLPK